MEVETKDRDNDSKAQSVEKLDNPFRNRILPSSKNTEQKLWTSNSLIYSSIASLAHLHVGEESQNLTATSLPSEFVSPDIDGWYAWVVLLCCCFFQIIYGIPISSSGIFYVEFLHGYERGEYTTSWICSSQVAFTYLLGPLAAVVMEKTSPRAAVMIGCIGAGASLAAASIADHFELLFVTYGSLTGASIAFIGVPATVIPALYFKRYRVVALCLVTVPASITVMCAPPMLTPLIEQYGWRDANMAVAAICIQGCLFAAMIRPPRSPKLQSDLEHSFESSESYSSLGGKLESIETETAVSPPNRGLCNSIKPILHWRVGALVTGNLLWGSAMSVFFVLFPDLAKLNGLTSQQTSMILTISGAMGTVGRIGCSALGLWAKCPAVFYLVGGNVITAAGLAVIAYSQLFHHFVIGGVLIILGYSLTTCFASPTILEMHGEEKIGLIFGLEMLAFGLGSSVTPPIVAFTYSVYASYSPGFLLAMALSLLSAAVYIPHIIALRCSIIPPRTSCVKE